MSKRPPCGSLTRITVKRKPDLFDAAIERHGLTSSNGSAKTGASDMEPAAPVSGLASLALVLDGVARFIRRFVVLDDPQLDAAVLWVAHTYVMGEADATPYLSVQSPLKRCGKSRLLETLELVVRTPWLTSRVTPAVLVRKIEAAQPTLLLDESDAAFGGPDEYSETLRGVLNAGHRRGGKCSLCVGRKHEFQDFSVFCPKAIAGIGGLPDTVTDRSIVIELARRTRTEKIERFRRREADHDAAALRDSLTAWASTVEGELRDDRPAIPDELGDRAADGWEPLLAVADRAGIAWSARARRAALSLSGADAVDDDSMLTRLLVDVRAVFDELQVESIASVSLAQKLGAIDESPWIGERGRDFDARRLAGLLRPLRIKPRTIRNGEAVFKGYTRASFAIAFLRYGGHCESYNGNKPVDKRVAQIPDELHARLRNGDESAAKPDVVMVVTDVTVAPPDTDHDGERSETCGDCGSHGGPVPSALDGTFICVDCRLRWLWWNGTQRIPPAPL